MTTRRPLPSQHGFILPLVMMLLIVLMASSASFFQRSSQDTRLSGANRDYDQARLLAESSMNLVLGRIVNFTAASTVAATTAAVVPCIAPANAPAVNDLNCDGLPDANQAKPDSFTPALPLPVGYEFFASTGAGITESTPRLIQMVANGEARNTGMAANSQAVLLNGANQLRVNDLFIDASLRPLLLTQDRNGLTFSGNTWSAESKPEKAAVWLEIARDPDPAHASWYDLYIESAAQVGTAKAYVQRFVGAYTDMLGAQVIAPLSEASNHP